MLENCSPKQREFIKRFRAGEQSGGEIVRELRVTPKQLIKWMRNRNFRQLVDEANRAIRVMNVLDMSQLERHGMRVAGELLSDDKARTQVAMQVVRQVNATIKQANRPRPPKPEQPMLIHPSQAHRAKELIEIIQKG
jgi:hypothetical protein